ncbi:hypothetical protein WS62_29655 [Burkholderia sp. ABCPW 14]|nr:hypothetical protein WS62_29655 [Burkholderia sp. ABCPW 14]
MRACGRQEVWLFADEVGFARLPPILYSLVQTCLANHIDVYQYLVDLFKALPHAKTAEDYEALLPWKQGRRLPEKNL